VSLLERVMANEEFSKVEHRVYVDLNRFVGFDGWEVFDVCGI
jgi:hypothetical protein